MSVSLDIGTRALRSLRQQGARLIGRQNMARYVVLPDRPQQRRLLESSSYRYATCEGSLLVIGRAAGELAETLQIPEIPLLRDGELPMDDPLARQVMASLIESLLPVPAVSGAICCLTPPTTVAEGDQVEFFEQLVRLSGYTPQLLDAGTAVLLSEMAVDGFTGIAVSFGAGSTRVSIAHRGNSCLRFSLPQGGDWIDAQLAESESSLLWDSEGNRYLNLREIATWKETQLISVTQPISEREQRVALLYEELLHELLLALKVKMSGNPYVLSLPKALPMVCSGGVTRVRGFIELMERALMECSLPRAVSELRRAVDSDYTVARGALIRAEVDSGATRGILSRVA